MRGLLIAAALPLLTAADWPGFRGDGTGAAPDAALPDGFTKESGLRFRAELPGRGVSSPVVVGRNVYVTCSSGPKDDRLHVLCFDAKTGEKKWHRQLSATGSTAAHPDTCMAAPTPAADASGVFALFATGDLAAFSPAGDLRWYRSIVGDYPAVTNQVGMAASPVLAGGRVVVPMDNPGDGFLGGIDPQTGKNAWKVPRPKDMNWTTPAVRTAPDGQVEVVFLGQSELAGYAAKDGSKRWAVKTSGSIPSPTLVGLNRVLAPGGGVGLFDLSGAKPKEVWRSPRLQVGMASPAVADGRVYCVTGSGAVACGDVATGKVVWQERVKGTFSASPVVGGGKLYLLNEAGVLTALKLGDKPEVLAESPTGERGQATPAIADGAVFFRTDKALYAVGAKG